MLNNKSLSVIKIIHTIIWFIMATASFYILYAGIFKIFDIWLYISIGLLVLETIVLIINKWTCPLTPMAMKHTENRADNFDIYLPLFVAKYNKQIFGAIFVIGLLLVLINFLSI